jgi:hypothetical protein
MKRHVAVSPSCVPTRILPVDDIARQVMPQGLAKIWCECMLSIKVVFINDSKTR